MKHYILSFSIILLLALDFNGIEALTNKDYKSGISLEALYFIGIILWGIAIAFYTSSSLTVGLNDLWLFILSGIFISFISAGSLLLFKILNPEKMRLPFALGAVVTLGLERQIENKIYFISHIRLIVLLTGI